MRARLMSQESSEYAIVETGGKQYRVQVGQRLQVEKLDAEVGSEVVLDKVLTVVRGEERTIGTPVVEGAKVTAKVVGASKGKKLIIFAKKIRQGFKKKKGHRQPYTDLLIEAIG